MNEETIRRIVREELDKRISAALDRLIVDDASALTPTADETVRRLRQSAARTALQSLQQADDPPHR